MPSISSGAKDLSFALDFSSCISLSDNAVPFSFFEVLFSLASAFPLSLSRVPSASSSEEKSCTNCRPFLPLFFFPFPLAAFFPPLPFFFLFPLPLRSSPESSSARRNFPSLTIRSSSAAASASISSFHASFALFVSAFFLADASMSATAFAAFSSSISSFLLFTLGSFRFTNAIKETTSSVLSFRAVFLAFRFSSSMALRTLRSGASRVSYLSACANDSPVTKDSHDR
mmetsp:Transcript_7296/g.15800  ORF Transcript_7296/g.15800 Transcript_7296/m.15800 type:complete len:228 (-) Transcript_7296:701-1384(-)